MNKKYLIGIDSDGTAFDSMTVKHKEAFIPVLIRIWHYEKEEDAVRTICEEINLYSSTRGIDRFSGLALTFETMKKQNIPVPDYQDLSRFLKESPRLSGAELKQYLKEHDSSFLRQVLTWSEEADRIFQEKMKTLKPFAGVLPFLKAAFPEAEIAVISSASEESLKKDWKKEDLLSYVDRIYGQESGTKKEQLQKAAQGRCGERILMVGDAPGDWKAVQAVNGLFYPILPGREEQSWEALRTKYLNAFLRGEFSDKMQKEVLEEMQ